MPWYTPTADRAGKSPTKRDYVAKEKYDKIIAEKVRSFDQLSDIDLPVGTQLRIISEKAFNAISMLALFTAKFEISEIVMAVYRMNKSSVDFISEIVENETIDCHILVSSFFKENKKYERWANDLAILGKDSVRANVGFAWSHAKILLCKTVCGRHFVFEGSGNFSDNARIEQYMLENNEAMYNFHKEWITEYIKDGNTKHQRKNGKGAQDGDAA